MEWEGEDSDGDLWEESWVSITYLSKDLREEARKLESELFGSRGTQAPSRRAARRNEVRQREKGATINGARDYEIGREGRLRNPATLEPQPGAD